MNPENSIRSSHESFKNSKLSFRKNTSSEILNATREMIENLSMPKDKLTVTDYQNKFKKIASSFNHTYRIKNILPKANVSQHFIDSHNQFL